MKNCFIYHNSRYYLLFPVASVGKDVNVNSVLLSHMIGQVRQMYTLMNVGVQPCNIYVDSWGLRRLVSLAIRRWKAPIHNFRETWLRMATVLPFEKFNSWILVGSKQGTAILIVAGPGLLWYEDASLHGIMEMMSLAWLLPSNGETSASASHPPVLAEPSKAVETSIPKISSSDPPVEPEPLEVEMEMPCPDKPSSPDPPPETKPLEVEMEAPCPDKTSSPHPPAEPVSMNVPGSDDPLPASLCMMMARRDLLLSLNG